MGTASCLVGVMLENESDEISVPEIIPVTLKGLGWCRIYVLYIYTYVIDIFTNCNVQSVLGVRVLFN